MDREILEKMPNTCDRQSLQQVKASEGGHDYGGFMYNVWRLQVETKKHNQRESVKERESERERVCVKERERPVVRDQITLHNCKEKCYMQVEGGIQQQLN